MAQHTRSLSLTITFAFAVVGCANVDADGNPIGGAEETARSDQALGSDCAPSAHSVDFAHFDTIPHGLAGDQSLVFVTQPLIGEVDALDRSTGHVVGTVPPPAAGFALAFQVRIPEPGLLAVLDIGGFPTPTTPAIPTIYEYRYRYDARRGTFDANLVRTIDFTGQPIIFADDFDFTPDGGYVMSESSIGALFLVARNGTVSEGIYPASEDPSDGIPALAPCAFPGTTIQGIPYDIEDGFGPGVGALTVHDEWVYFASTCTGGVARVPLRTLSDRRRTPAERAADIETVSPRPAGVAVESIEGLSFDRFDPANTFLYATDDYNLRVIRIDVNTGRREVVASDPVLFNFPVTTQFLPPVSRFDAEELVVLSDQEYRFSAVNTAIATDMFVPPFIVAKVSLRR